MDDKLTTITNTLF